MKVSVAVILVVVSMVSAEVPRHSRQTAPYTARGWRPAGPQFNLPQRVQQAYGPPTPVPSYGPPAEEPEVVTTTTEPSTTEPITEVNDAASQSENLEDLSPTVKPDKLERPDDEVAGQFYVVLPQRQNLLYAVPQHQQRASLVAAPVRLQTVPFGPAVSTSIFTPFSASYVQIYQ